MLQVEAWLDYALVSLGNVFKSLFECGWGSGER